MENSGPSFAHGLRYLTSDVSNPEDYKKLSDILAQWTRKRGTQGNGSSTCRCRPTSTQTVKQLGAAG